MKLLLLLLFILPGCATQSQKLPENNTPEPKTFSSTEVQRAYERWKQERSKKQADETERLTKKLNDDLQRTQEDVRMIQRSIDNEPK